MHVSQLMRQCISFFFISLSTTSNVAYAAHQGISAEENMQAEVTNTTIGGEVDERTDNSVY